MKQAEKLIIISAPSGAGKTTLCQRLLKDFSTGLMLSVSSTTRLPRSNEVNSKDYFFMNRDEFEDLAHKGYFAEWALVHGHYYGTSRDVIDGAFSKGKSVLLDIDVQGAAQLKKAYPKQCLSFFIAPPSIEVLEDRLRGRGTDDEHVIRKRIQNALQDRKSVV